MVEDSEVHNRFKLLADNCTSHKKLFCMIQEGIVAEGYDPNVIIEETYSVVNDYLQGHNLGRF